MMKNFMRGKDKGFALLTAIVVMALVIGIGYAVIQLVIKEISISGGTRRYSSAAEAAEGSLEQGYSEIQRYVAEAQMDSSIHAKLGSYRVNVSISPLFTSYLSGSAIEFAGGYEGLGYGLSGGGAASYFMVESNSRGPRQESVGIEVVYRKVLNVRGREQ